jgi:ABC-type arginine/histidine transport system permease subunit
MCTTPKTPSSLRGIPQGDHNMSRSVGFELVTRARRLQIPEAMGRTGQSAIMNVVATKLGSLLYYRFRFVRQAARGIRLE